MHIHRDDEKPDNSKIIRIQNNYKKIYRFPKSKYGREKSNQFPISSIDYTAKEASINSIHTSKQIITQLYREAYQNNKFIMHRGKFAREFPQTTFYSFCNQKLSIIYTINKDQYSRNQTYLSDPKKDIEKTRQIDNNPACFVSPPPPPPPPEPDGYGNANINWMGSWNNLVGNLTSVGTNGRPSYYGTYDQTGNTWEWLDRFVSEDDVGDAFYLYEGTVVARGGGWFNWADDCANWSYALIKATDSGDIISFRIASSTNPLNLQMVDVEDVGNQSNNDGLGSVSYIYKIGKYTITNCEYVDFLNSIASTDTYQLYNTRMASDPRGGIVRSGTPGEYTYQSKQNMENKPVIYVSWFDCARYCNWLHNGKPVGNQNSSSTEDGAYTLLGLNPINIVKNNGAFYWIPSENEWYKAAYYVGGSTNAGYWYYATQSMRLGFVTADEYGNGIINGAIKQVSDFVCLTSPIVTPTNTPTNTTTPTVTPTNTTTPTVTPTPTLSPTQSPCPDPIIKNIFVDEISPEHITLAINSENNSDCCCNIKYSLDENTWQQLSADNIDCLSGDNCLPAKLLDGFIYKILEDDSIVISVDVAHNASCCCSFIYSLDDIDYWSDVPQELIECEGSYYIPPTYQPPLPPVGDCQCNAINAPYSGSTVNVDGIEITASYSGSVNLYPNTWNSCGATTPANCLHLGSSSSFQYTMNFNTPINKIKIILTGTGQTGNENFIFTTNNGIPSISSNCSCYSLIDGNLIISGADATSSTGNNGGGGGGIFIIENSSPFTSLTISGDGGHAGSLFAICPTPTLIGLNSSTLNIRNFIP